MNFSNKSDVLLCNDDNTHFSIEVTIYRSGWWWLAKYNNIQITKLCFKRLSPANQPILNYHQPVKWAFALIEKKRIVHINLIIRLNILVLLYIFVIKHLFVSSSLYGYALIYACEYLYAWEKKMHINQTSCKAKSSNRINHRK